MGIGVILLVVLGVIGVYDKGICKQQDAVFKDTAATTLGVSNDDGRISS